MARINPYLEPVYRDDIESHCEDIRALWMTQYDLWMKMSFQKAPEEVQQAFSRASETLRETWEIVNQFQDWFPEDGR